MKLSSIPSTPLSWDFSPNKNLYLASFLSSGKKRMEKTRILPGLMSQNEKPWRQAHHICCGAMRRKHRTPPNSECTVSQCAPNSEGSLLVLPVTWSMNDPRGQRATGAQPGGGKVLS